MKDSNQLIAEFMGAENSSFGDYMVFTIQNPQYVGKINHSEILYNSDWNWLIPVIEKISSFKYEDGDTAYVRTFGMLNLENGKRMFRFNRHKCFEDDNLIGAAYSAVLDFINFHNQTNS